MKKQIRTFVGLTMLCMSLTAQAQTFQWAKRNGSTGFDQLFSTTTDPNGNILSTGSFNGSVNFNPNSGTATTLTSAGAEDIFVQKLTTAGTIVWAKRFGGTSSNVGKSIKCDQNGNSYITGYFVGSMIITTTTGSVTLTSSGAQDMFIMKLDSNGDCLWAKRIGGSSNDGATELTIDASDNLVITGNFAGTVNFNTGGSGTILTANSMDVFVLKLDQSGNFIFAKSFKGAASSNSMGYSLSTDNLNNIYVTGYYTGTVDFNPDPTLSFNLTASVSSTSPNDGFITKLNSTGDFQWAKSIGGGGNSELQTNSIIANKTTGEVYITGYLKGTNDINPHPTTVTNMTASLSSDAFLLKLTTAGDLIWAKQLNSNFHGTGTGLALDTEDNIYTAGAFQGTIDLDPGTNSVPATADPGRHGFIQVLSPAGNYIWSATYGISANVQHSVIALDAINSIVVGGYFTGTGDFNSTSGTTTLASAGISDNYLIRYTQCVTPNTGTLNGVSSICVGNSTSFTSTVSGGTWTSSNPAVATIDPVTGLVTGISPGFITMTYTVTGLPGCPNGTSTRPLSVYAQPNIGKISGPATLCETQTGTFTNSVSGGIWSSSNTAVATINSTTGVLNALSPGTTTITYTIVGPGCSSIVTKPLTVYPINNCTPFTGGDQVLSIETMETWFTAFPNPTTSNVKIESAKTLENVTISVTDLLGKTILSQEYASFNGAMIDIPGAPGMYMIVIKTKTGQHSLRIQKQ